VSTVTPQPPPQPGAAPHSVDLVVVDLASRKRYGVAKYGVAHQHDNGRDHLVDLYQELLDGAVYVRAEIERRREVPVSRALVERAYETLNAGPGSAGIARALALLREAIDR
jgi:hypothetical protein